MNKQGNGKDFPLIKRDSPVDVSNSDFSNILDENVNIETEGDKRGLVYTEARCPINVINEFKHSKLNILSVPNELEGVIERKSQTYGKQQAINEDAEGSKQDLNDSVLSHAVKAQFKNMTSAEENPSGVELQHVCIEKSKVYSNLSSSKLSTPDLCSSIAAKHCSSSIDDKNSVNLTKGTMLHLPEKQPGNNSVPSYCSYITHGMNSDALIRETELELNKLHQLTSKSSLQKQSLYKLAYDENITDQSENEDQEEIKQLTQDEKQHLPSNEPLHNSGARSEILVHEADSASDAGSEDVELLPHRYESESAQCCNKHIYVNNLSLAVELLRTRESLPYDDEFKRIVREDFEQSTEQVLSRTYTPITHQALVNGKINPGFVSDGCSERIQTSFLPKRKTDISCRNMPTASPKSAFTTATEWRNSATESRIQTTNSGDEVAEEAEDGGDEPRRNLQVANNSQHQPRSVRRNFSILAPSSGIVNPCLCCTIL